MILIDLNQVIIASLMVSSNANSIDENMIRHITLNVIRSYRKKFKEEYGEIVICCDNKNFWRKSVFPFYKANRKKDRELSNYDWNAIFQSLAAMRNELKTFFPYKVIEVETAEADDIIGVLVNTYSQKEKMLIVSSDKDFLQLQKNGVKQYSPILNKFISSDNPDKYLQEHIMNGDRGDGIPNFLSSDNTFVAGVRQKSLTKKKMAAWIGKNKLDICGSDNILLKQYERNEQLIDLSKIPVQLKKDILDNYANCIPAKTNLIDYFMNNGLKNLFELIHEFKD